MAEKGVEGKTNGDSAQGRGWRERGRPESSSHAAWENSSWGPRFSLCVGASLWSRTLSPPRDPGVPVPKGQVLNGGAWLPPPSHGQVAAPLGRSLPCPPPENRTAGRTDGPPGTRHLRGRMPGLRNRTGAAQEKVARTPPLSPRPGPGSGGLLFRPPAPTGPSNSEVLLPPAGSCPELQASVGSPNSPRPTLSHWLITSGLPAGDPAPFIPSARPGFGKGLAAKGAPSTLVLEKPSETQGKFERDS